MRWNSFVDCLHARATTQPERIAIFELAGMREVRKELSYQALDRRVRAVAARLQKLGAVDQRALIVMANDIDYVVAFLACAYAGCVSINLVLPSREKHISRLCHVADDCDATLLLTQSSRVAELQKKLVGNTRPLTWLCVDEVPETEATDYQPFWPAADAICYLQYTSGSTGQPRGVAVSHGNLIANSLQIQQGFGFHAGDKGLSWLPLYHDMGLILGILQPLFSGFPVGLSDPLSFVKHPDRWLRAISSLGITYTGGPNFTYDVCVQFVEPAQLAGVDLSGWRVALNGAEPIRAETLRRFAEMFEPFGWQASTMHPAYGLAEATLVVVTKPRGTLPVVKEVDVAALGQGLAQAPLERRRRLVSSGCVMPDVRIVDPDAHTLQADGQVGEIWLSGPSVTKGYWRRPEETRAQFQAMLLGEPCLRTGDLGFVADGQLFVTGRLKDVIILHGVNHYPQDLEETIERADQNIRPHFVAAFSEEQGDREKLIVVAEVRREAEPKRRWETIVTNILRAVAREHELQVDEVHLVHMGQVPKTTSGKIQRSACRALLRAGQLEIHGSYQRGSAP